MATDEHYTVTPKTQAEQSTTDTTDSPPPPLTAAPSNNASRPDDTRFPPDEEQKLLSESNEHKAHANKQFGSGSYEEAIQTYSKSLASCPNYLEYEIAVLRSNVSACHLKLSEWKDAVESATKALERLDVLDPPRKVKKDANEANNKALEEPAQDDRIVEIDDAEEARIEALGKSGRTLEEVQKLRIKTLLRRAKARTELGGWAALQGADEDYKQLSSMPLSPLDRKAVDSARRTLPSKLDAAKNKEMGDMMGKLKDLGNGILKPFGLSTNNFNFVKDEKTGGYSMNFNQGAK